MITQIFKEKFSDYKAVDVILKFWLGGLMAMWVVGMIAIITHIVTNPSALNNVTFGIFDTLG